MSWFRRSGVRAPSDPWLAPTTGRWLLLVTAIAQAWAPVVIDFDGSSSDPPVVPAGYAFSIWSAIILGCLAVAAYGMPRRRAELGVYRAVHLPLSLVQVLFVAWLLAATSSTVWLTLPIFVTMLALSAVALHRVLTVADRAKHGRVARGLLVGTLGVYAGWSTAAVWVNAATLLTDAGLDAAGAVGTAWQSLVLAGATASAVLLLRRLQGSLPYVGAVGWALVGVVVNAAMAGMPGLVVAAVLGLSVVVVATVAARRSTRLSGLPA
jgi:hypothetical protein